MKKKYKKIRKYAGLYIMLAIPFLWYIIFKYIPMYGLQIAFKRFNPTLGITKSPWVGLTYFKQFFDSYYFGNILWNTVSLSLFTMLVGFPMPIILALLINEIKNTKFQKVVQNITYMPNFLSVVVIVSMLTLFSNRDYGLFNKIGALFGAAPVDFMAKPAWFQPLYVFSNVWQYMGFNAIIYIAALASVDQELYEAASIDGASRMQKIIHISLPCIMGTIIIMFIMRIGSLMSVGFEKVYLMQNSVTLSASEVISTFIYKNGIQKGQFSYSTAVGLFNSVINFTLLMLANFVSKKATKTSLW
ncbi:MAG: ABC transporter permease subunit [Blautia sp.]|uniref:ABC transporter permease n=1 Tax=Blautia sp. OF03-15BH TaxID=2292287 RepID=UPI000E478501|nr:ABC transporter permease subunit [Blautia sp. OF03-15BH]MCI5858392.1 ABC transporter permease subunit [Blautia sp.]MDD5966304.1 ABC transporter permease subunit [Blautia sp.]RGY01315.1 sugar ABC transporter permease [Blautia sp. OF03-15BH]